jgi:tetratricopeptide (TPR) repeat protein
MMRSMCVLTVSFLLAGTPAEAAAGPEELLSQAKLAMFDGQWRQALEKIRLLRTLSPSESVLASSLFYEARALEKLGRLEESLEAYDRYLERSDRDSALLGEARSSVIRLAVDLHRSGRRGHLERALGALRLPDRDLSFLAALQLSRLPEESVRRQAVPVLQRELKESGDPEVRNQASLALLRIDPRLLEAGTEREPSARRSSAVRSLRLLITGDGDEEVRLALPVSLARLLLSSLPDSAREDLRREGIQADNLVEELSRAGEILEIKTPDGLIRIWID